MVSSKKMRGLIAFDDAVSLCRWSVAERYFEYGDKIYPDPEAGWKWTTDKPLADSNLFLSFSRLGARGEDLPKPAILRWIRKHGLLRLKNPNANRLTFDNQAPIMFSEFREEARQAHEALTLFEAIHSNNYDELRSRISKKRTYPPGRPGEGDAADVYLDGRPIPMSRRASSELDDEDVLSAAKSGLEWFVQVRLRGFDLSFDHFSGHPRAQEVYRPRLVFSIPDLYTALWYQFALLMTDNRPVKFCLVCEAPIFRPRRDQKTCSPRCRKVKSRRERKAGEG